jgi:hypothetical protein
MKPRVSAFSVSGLEPPTSPTDESIKAIAKSFKLTKAQGHELRLEIKHLMADVEVYINTLKSKSPRADLANRLKRIGKALRRVHYEVEKSGDMLNELLPFDVTEKLGAKLTFAAISQAVGSPKTPRSFHHFVQQVESQDGRLTMEGLERVFETQRRTLGIEHGHLLFKAMIDDLYRPFARWVELDRKPPGAPPLFFRNLVIKRLAKASKDILGSKATSTAGGRFVQLCDAVLTAMKLPSDGVEKAAAAVLKRMKSRTTGRGGA